VMVDSRDSDRNQLRVLVLRVGLNVAREVIQEMEHILARTEAKL